MHEGAEYDAPQTPLILSFNCAEPCRHLSLGRLLRPQCQWILSPAGRQRLRRAGIRFRLAQQRAQAAERRLRAAGFGYCFGFQDLRSRVLDCDLGVGGVGFPESSEFELCGFRGSLPLALKLKRAADETMIPCIQEGSA